MTTHEPIAVDFNISPPSTDLHFPSADVNNFFHFDMTKPLQSNLGKPTSYIG
jgi:hypothetical protein